MTKSDAEFLAALEKSQVGVGLVACWLKELGYDIRVKSADVRPSFGERMNYADSGDIEIRKRIEVKQRNLHFTCREDFPYSTIFVDEKYKVDKINPKRLAAYIMVNENATHVAIIDGSTMNKWKAVKKYDSTNDDTRESYVCPIDLVQFVEL